MPSPIARHATQPVISRFLTPGLAPLLVLGGMSSAMAIELRDVLPRGLMPSRASMAQAERQQKQDELNRKCEQLKGWIASAGLDPARAPRTVGELQNATLALLADPQFPVIFGKPYEQLSYAELGELQGRLLSQCFSAQGALGGPGGMYWNVRGALHSALSPQRQAQNLALLTAQQSAVAGLDRLSAELQTLPADAAGYARLVAIRRDSAPWLKKASADQLGLFNKAQSEAAQRVAAPVESAEVEAAVNAAKGYEGLQQLTGLATTLQQRAMPYPGLSGQLAKIGAKQNALSAEIAGQERARVDLLGSGLTALERGVQWQGEYDGRYQRWAGQFAGLAELQAYFLERRAVALGASGAALTSQIQRAGSEAQLDALQQRYLLNSDLRTVPGTGLQTALLEQRRLIEKNSALGSQVNETRAPAPAAAPAPRGTLAGGGGPPREPGASEGEPSAAEMYDLVRQIYDRRVKEVQDIQAKCRAASNGRGGGGGNIFDMGTCLSYQLSGALGAGEPIKILRFEKLGCADARPSGKPGYYCEFSYEVSGAYTQWMGPITQSLMRGDSVANARFLRRGGGWTMLYKQDDIR